jgi:Flp pilus assembly pilin Flp
MDLLALWEQVGIVLRGRFGGTQRGASLVEYALLIALIGVVCVVALSVLGKNASKKFSTVGSAIQ